MDTQSFVDAVDRARVVDAIRAAEARSSGEIAVHVSEGEVDDVEKAAAAQFAQQGLTATRDHNAVLLFVAPRSRKFAVIGDAAIHSKCGPSFWTEVAQAMQEDFRAARFTEGLVKGVARVGDALAVHFPRRKDDVNELPDEVTG